MTFDHTKLQHQRTAPRATLTSDSLENARERGDYLEAILNNISDCIITIDSRGRILSMNPAGCALFGYTMKELKDKNAGILIPANNGTEELVKYMANYDKTGVSTIINGSGRDVHGKCKDGKVISIELKVSSFITAGGEIAYVGLIRDRTERNGTRQTLIDINVKLTRQVIELEKAHDELREAAIVAETANRSKSDFLANMSHELRTPLNAIIGFSEVLTTEIFGKLNEKQVDYADCIHTSGQHLLSLINDVLDLSKVEAGQYDLYKTNVDVDSIVTVCHRFIKEKAHNKNITVIFDVTDDLHIFADEGKLKQILLNLLTNAVKFTNEEGTVKVISREHDGLVCLVVTDDGIGMDEEGIAKALTPFGQAISNSLVRTQEGTGLGVPLTKTMVELHGGKFNITSELGVGTTIEVCLPKGLDK